MSLGSLGRPGRLGWVGSHVCRVEPTDRRLSPNGLIMRALQSGTNPWSDTRAACVGGGLALPQFLATMAGTEWEPVAGSVRIIAGLLGGGKGRFSAAGDRLQSRLLPARTGTHHRG